MKMLFVLAKKNESGRIFDLINEIDPAAFVSQSAVIGVYGEGFDRFKVRQKKSSQNKLAQKKQGNSNPKCWQRLFHLRTMLFDNKCNKCNESIKQDKERKRSANETNLPT